MRIMGKLLYMICGALAFVLLFIAFCSQNPGVTEQMGQMFSKKNASENANAASEKYVTATVTRSESYAAEASDSENGNEENLNIPSKVAQLTGYIPVRPSGTAVTQEKADEIASALSKGETGEGLSFDEEFYPYYAMLNDAQKSDLPPDLRKCECDDKKFCACGKNYGIRFEKCVYRRSQ